MTYQDRIFPYDINTISSRLVMGMTQNINYGITCCLNTKFFKSTS